MSDSIVEAKDYFETVLEHGKNFCAATGLKDDLPLRIYKAPDDWTFILQVDALHEAACREIALRIPVLKIGNKDIPYSERKAFIDKLPINGDKSLIKLLTLNGIQPDLLHLVSDVRKIRNAYAHDIRNIDTPLLNTIRRQLDASPILESFSPIKPEAYVEEEVLEMFASTPGLLRFGILCESLRFLTLAYLHIADAQRSNGGIA